MRPLNVLWATDRVGYGSHLHGPGRRLLTIAPELDPARVRLTACVLRAEDPELSRLFTGRGVRLRYLGKHRLDPTTFARLARIVREEKIDLLHLTGYGASDFGRMVSAVTGVPAIVHVTDHYYPWYQAVADRLLARYTDAVLAVSSSVVTTSPMFRRARLRDRARILRNPVDLRDFKPSSAAAAAALRSELGIAPERALVGCIGRLHEEKGLRHLLDAVPEIARSVPDSVFLIVGDGPARSDLQAQARALRLEGRIVFHGFRSDVGAVLSILDVVVVPSLTEGFPNLVLEAMAVGRALVASGVEGIAELLVHDQTGWLVAPGDSAGLAAGIVRLLRQPEERARLARNARAAAQHFDLRAYVLALEEVYAQVAAERGAR